MPRARLPGERNLAIVRTFPGGGDLGVRSPSATVPDPRVRLIEGVVSSDHPDDVAPLLRGEVNLRVLNIGRVPRVVEVLLRSPRAARIGPTRDIMRRVTRDAPVDTEGG